MARLVVMGSVARDEVVRLAEPLRAGAHLNGTALGARLGGGGANTAVALAAAGHDVALLAAVGDDAEGDASLAELKAAGVGTADITRLNSPTTHSLILLEPAGERTVVNLTRCEPPAPPSRLLDLQAEAVYVRSRRTDLAPLLAQKAASSLILAHMPPVEAGSRPAHILVASTTDLAAGAVSDPLALGRAVAGRLLRWVVITNGAAGARAVSADGAWLHAAAARVEALDTTGAGDAFAAGLVHAVASNMSMAEALAMAVRFGTEATQWASSGLPAEAVRRLIGR